MSLSCSYKKWSKKPCLRCLKPKTQLMTVKCTGTSKTQQFQRLKQLHGIIKTGVIDIEVDEHRTLIFDAALFYHKYKQ